MLNIKKSTQYIYNNTNKKRLEKYNYRKINKFTCNIERGLIVLDDMMYDNNILKDKYIRHQ